MISEYLEEKFQRLIYSSFAYEVVVVIVSLTFVGIFTLCLIWLNQTRDAEEISSHDYQYVYNVSERYDEINPIVSRAIADNKITRREFREIVDTVSEITSRERIDQIKDVVREGAGL